MELGSYMCATTTRRLLSPLLVLLSLFITLLSTVHAAQEDGKGWVIFPHTTPEEIYFLEDTIIVTYINADRPGPMTLMCSDEFTGHGMSPTEWKSILEVPVIPAPNGTQAIRVKEKDMTKLTVDFNWYTCAFKVGWVKDERYPESGGGFKLMNIRRPGGPTTVGEAEASQYSATATLPAAATLTSTTQSMQALSATTTPSPTLTDTTAGPGITTTSTNLNDTSPTGSTAGLNAENDSGTKDGGGGLSAVAMAGIGVGAGVAVIAVAGLWFLCYWRGRRKALAAAVAAATSHQQMEEEQRKGDVIKTPGSGTQQSPSSYYGQGHFGQEPIKEKPQLSELGAVETGRHEVDGGSHGWQNMVELA